METGVYFIMHSQVVMQTQYYLKFIRHKQSSAANTIVVSEYCMIIIGF